MNYTLLTAYNFGTNNIATNANSVLLATNTSLVANINAQVSTLNSTIANATNGLNNTKQPASLTLTNLAATGAFTNALAAGQNFSLTTNFSGNTIILNATNQTFLTNGLVGASITNGFAPISYVLNQISATNTANLTITTNLVIASTNGLATLANVASTNTANLIITTNLVNAAVVAAQSTNSTVVFAPIPTWTSGAIADQNNAGVYYTVTNKCGVLVFDAGAGFFDGEDLKFTNFSGGSYFVLHNGTNYTIPSEQVYVGLSGLSLYTFTVAIDATATLNLVRSNYLNLSMNSVVGMSNKLYFVEESQDGIGIGVNNFLPSINIQPNAESVDFDDQSGLNKNLVSIGAWGLAVGDGGSNAPSVIGLTGIFNGRYYASNMIGSLNYTNISGFGNVATLSSNQVVNMATNGLKSAAYSLATAFDASGAALAATNGLSNGAFTTVGSAALLSSNTVVAMATNGFAPTNFVLTQIAATNTATLAAIVNSTNGGNIVFTNNAMYYMSLTNANQFVSSVSGIATNLMLSGNFAMGAKTNWAYTTNVIGLNLAGSSFVDGTYVGNGLLMTNPFYTNFIIVLTGGNYYVQSNGVSLYQSADVKTWTIVNGAAPAPYGSFGHYDYDNGNDYLGWFYSTNLTWQIGQAITASNQASSQWMTTGNTVTNGIIGTLTAQPFSIIANNQTGMVFTAPQSGDVRITAGTKNFIAVDSASSSNRNSAILSGQSNYISGGYLNDAYDGRGHVIVGGDSNTNTSTGFGFIGTGWQNALLSFPFEAIVDGVSNSVHSVFCGTILNGSQNYIGLNFGTGTGFQTIINGSANYNNSIWSLIGGGDSNSVSGGTDNVVLNGTHNTIGYGRESQIINGVSNNIATYYLIDQSQQIINGTLNFIDGAYSTIVDGINNKIGGAFGSTYFSTIINGGANLINIGASNSIIGSGYLNTIQNRSPYSFIGVGLNSYIGNDARNSFIGGGTNNLINDNAMNATIVAGVSNIINNSGVGDFIIGSQNTTGATNSIAVGNNATVTNANSTILNDGSPVSSTTNNQLTLSFANGINAVGPLFNNGILVLTNSAASNYSFTNYLTYTNDARALTLTNGANLISGNGVGLTNLNPANLVGLFQNIVVSNTVMWTNNVTSTNWASVSVVSNQVVFKVQGNSIMTVTNIGTVGTPIWRTTVAGNNQSAASYFSSSTGNSSGGLFSNSGNGAQVGFDGNSQPTLYSQYGQMVGYDNSVGATVFYDGSGGGTSIRYNHGGITDSALTNWITGTTVITIGNMATNVAAYTLVSSPTAVASSTSWTNVYGRQIQLIVDGIANMAVAGTGTLLFTNLTTTENHIVAGSTVSIAGATYFSDHETLSPNDIIQYVPTVTGSFTFTFSKTTVK